MKVIRELEPATKREFMSVLVQGADGHHYKVVAMKLYENEVTGHANYEVSAYRTDENGEFKILIGFYRGRWDTKDEAVKDHKRVVQKAKTGSDNRLRPCHRQSPCRRRGINFQARTSPVHH
jgi:hypothetical protein